MRSRAIGERKRLRRARRACAAGPWRTVIDPARARRTCRRRRPARSSPSTRTRSGVARRVGPPVVVGARARAGTAGRSRSRPRAARRARRARARRRRAGRRACRRRSAVRTQPVHRHARPSTHRGPRTRGASPARDRGRRPGPGRAGRRPRPGGLLDQAQRGQPGLGVRRGGGRPRRDLGRRAGRRARPARERLGQRAGGPELGARARRPAPTQPGSVERGRRARRRGARDRACRARRSGRRRTPGPARASGVGALAADVGDARAPTTRRRRSRRDRARKSIAVASCDQRRARLRHRVAQHAADDVGEVRRRARGTDRGAARASSSRRSPGSCPTRSCGGRPAPRSSRARRRRAASGEHTVGPVHITSTSAGRPAPSSREVRRRARADVLGRAQRERRVGARARSRSSSHVASAAWRGARPGCIGMSSSSSRNHDTPASRSGCELGEQRGAVGVRLVVDVETGRDREAEPHAVRVGVRGELAEARELVGVVRDAPLGPVLGVVLRRVHVRVHAPRREERDRPRGGRRASTASRRSPRRCRARRTRAAIGRAYTTGAGTLTAPIA